MGKRLVVGTTRLFVVANRFSSRWEKYTARGFSNRTPVDWGLVFRPLFSFMMEGRILVIRYSHIPTLKGKLSFSNWKLSHCTKQWIQDVQPYENFPRIESWQQAHLGSSESWDLIPGMRLLWNSTLRPKIELHCPSLHMIYIISSKEYSAFTRLGLASLNALSLQRPVLDFE